VLFVSLKIKVTILATWAVNFAPRYVNILNAKKFSMLSDEQSMLLKNGMYVYSAVT
jgi:hypothetical protein